MCFLLVFSWNAKSVLHLHHIWNSYWFSWEDKVTECNLDYMLMQLTCKQQQQRAFSHSFDAHFLSEPRVQRAIDMWCGREAGFMCRRAVYWLLWGLQPLDVSGRRSRVLFLSVHFTRFVKPHQVSWLTRWRIVLKLAHTWEQVMPLGFTAND